MAIHSAADVKEPLPSAPGGPPCTLPEHQANARLWMREDHRHPELRPIAAVPNSGLLPSIPELQPMRLRPFTSADQLNDKFDVLVLHLEMQFVGLGLDRLTRGLQQS